MDWKRKLTSRKFWAAVCTLVANLVIVLGGTEETSVQITALIMAGAAVIAYIVGEGLADAAGAAAQTEYLLIEDEPEGEPEDKKIVEEV